MATMCACRLPLPSRLRRGECDSVLLKTSGGGQDFSAEVGLFELVLQGTAAGALQWGCSEGSQSSRNAKCCPQTEHGDPQSAQQAFRNNA